MNNSSIHKQLAKIYGDKCMFLAAHCDDAHFRKFVKKHRFKEKEHKRLVHTITVHHLKHRSEGGLTSNNNCSLVCELAHLYLHSLPRKEEEKYNNQIRNYKKSYKKCKVVFSDDIPNIEFRCGIISPNDLNNSKDKDHNNKNGSRSNNRSSSNNNSNNNKKSNNSRNNSNKKSDNSSNRSKNNRSKNNNNSNGHKNNNNGNGHKSNNNSNGHKNNNNGNRHKSNNNSNGHKNNNNGNGNTRTKKKKNSYHKGSNGFSR